MTARFEVAVIGGGLAGACAAALLARHGGIAPAQIALFAPEQPAAPAPDAPPQLRVAALSRAGERVLRAAGAWHRLDAARLCAYEHMRIWHETATPAGTAALRFDAADIGEPNLGTIAELNELQRACLGSFIAAGGTVLAAPPQQLEIGADEVRFECDGAPYAVRLAVGADGGRSSVREQAGIDARVRDYHQSALVANVGTSRPHAATAWQRFLHTGPLALLPLYDGSCSIVWSLDEPAARAALDCSAARFEEQLNTAAAGALGSLRLLGERRSFPLRSIAADGYVAPRCALIGDAAHVIHPLAGQGANLGLLDAAALCTAVAGARAEGEDPGALRALRHYEQARRTHNLAVDAAMSAFQYGFAAARGPTAWLLNQGLVELNRSGTLKRLLARAALGLDGELPALARG